MVRASFDVGASGYVFQSCMVPDLITAIEAALNDAVFVPTISTYTSSSSNLASPEGQLRAKIVSLQTQESRIDDDGSPIVGATCGNDSTPKLSRGLGSSSRLGV
jgi:hypothetical protein